tara:strand:+ start:1576 stop:1995 length:420 start_codon:yes stop_codon:yes gene_type:complete
MTKTENARRNKTCYIISATLASTFIITTFVGLTLQSGIHCQFEPKVYTKYNTKYNTSIIERFMQRLFNTYITGDDTDNNQISFDIHDMITQFDDDVRKCCQKECCTIDGTYLQGRVFENGICNGEASICDCSVCIWENI